VSNLHADLSRESDRPELRRDFGSEERIASVTPVLADGLAHGALLRPDRFLDKVAYAWTIIDGLTQIDATYPPSVRAAPAISRF
jgi:hypothetical protein